MREARHLVRARQPRPVGATSSTASTSPQHTIGSPSSGKYVHLVDTYMSLHEALRARRRRPRRQGRVRVHRLETRSTWHDPPSLGAARRAGARRLRRARHGGQDPPRSATPARRSRSSASAWACSSRWSSTARDVARQPEGSNVASSTRTPAPVIDLMNRSARGDAARAAPCGWARSRAARGRQPGRAASTARRDQRAPPPPLRGEQRLPRSAHQRRPGAERHQPRRPPGRDRRAARAPALHRLPVPPRVQVRPMAAHPLFSHFVAAALRRRDELAASARGEAGQKDASSSVN
jgi:hypothetical protein